MRSASVSGPRTDLAHRRTRSIPRSTYSSTNRGRFVSARSHDECDDGTASGDGESEVLTLRHSLEESRRREQAMERELTRARSRSLSVGAASQRQGEGGRRGGRQPLSRGPLSYSAAPPSTSPNRLSPTSVSSSIDEDMPEDELAEARTLDKLGRQNVELERLRAEGRQQQVELQRLQQLVRQQQLQQPPLTSANGDPSSPPMQLRRVYSYGDDPTAATPRNASASLESASGYVDIVAAPVDDVSPLKTTDSPGGLGKAAKAGAAAGEDGPALVSPGEGGSDGDGAAVSSDGGGTGGEGRRGRSRGPRPERGRHLPAGPSHHRSAAASPSPAPGPSGGVRRLGRAVDAVLARRKRGGAGAGPSPLGGEAPDQALNDEEKYVLAKIIVAIDSKLEKELEAVKSELSAKTVEEGKVQEELERERDRIIYLEKELEEVKESARDRQNKGENDGKGEGGESDRKAAEAALAEERKAMEEKLAEAERDHERSIRAIQRVLADVTTERDEKIEELRAAVETLTTEKNGLADQLAIAKEEQSEVQRLTGEVDELKSERQRLERKKSEDAAALEDERTKVRSLTEEVERLKSEQQQQQQASAASSTVGGGGDLDALRAENEALKKDVKAKTSSLETAKMMITSLETANGSQANDLRAKLKERNEEVATLKIKVEGDGNEIASLKEEVIDLQKKFVEAEKSGREAKAQLKKQRYVHRRLKTEIGKISNNNVTSTGGMGGEEEEVEVAIVEEVSAAVQNSLRLLVEGGDGKEDAPASGEGEENGIGDEVEELTRKLESMEEEKEATTARLNSELAKSDATLRDMEDAMRSQKEEMEQFRAEAERVRAEHEASIAASQAVIQCLRDESAMNSERLAKKEQELTVLRESLKEPSTGYISDDDEDEEEQEDAPEVDVASRSAKLSVEAENLELMLVQGNASSKAVEAQLQTLLREREEAANKMKQQEESLANAKMIISSLEKSNKSMLEDLRNRLHDSNTAIVSLLEKSTKHEEAAASLKSEVERIRREKDQEKASLEAEAKKLKEEAIESADKVTEKSRQVEELQKTVERYESYARRMRLCDDSTVSSLGTDEGSNIYLSDGKEESSFDAKDSDAEGKFPVPESALTIPRDSEEEV